MTDTNASPQIDTMPNLTWRDFLLDTAPVHVSYFREPVNGKHILCHTLVAIDVDSVAYVGISMCHETDAFSRPKGKAIAYGRAQKLLGSVRMNARRQSRLQDYMQVAMRQCTIVRSEVAGNGG